MNALWIVKIHEDDFEYDCFVSGVVWGKSAAEAKQMIRAGVTKLPKGDKTRFVAKLAPTSGIVHEHWHAG